MHLVKQFLFYNKEQKIQQVCLSRGNFQERLRKSEDEKESRILLETKTTQESSSSNFLTETRDPGEIFRHQYFTTTVI